MRGREAYKHWAPAGARWVEWVRPVPFAAMGGSHRFGTGEDFAIPPILYLEQPQENTAVIVNAPGAQSIPEGIALARLGFRPVPLYNGTNPQPGAMALVEHRAVEQALEWGAAELAKLSIPLDAPPAFLLDSNRTQRYKMDASVFDNSWDLYEQDVPSAAYFIDNGIHNIIIRGETVQKDLRKLLYPFQKKGITILLTDGYNPPRPVALRGPPRRRGQF